MEELFPLQLEDVKVRTSGPEPIARAQQRLDWRVSDTGGGAASTIQHQQDTDEIMWEERVAE